MITKAVILLAGYGTRCLPFTKVLPKGMIPILSKPSIAFIVEELEQSGVSEIIFVLPKNCNGKVIKQYFLPAKKYEKFLTKRKNKSALQTLKSINTQLKTIFLFTSKANGSGGALLVAKKHLGNQDFCVLNGDDLFFGFPPLKQMMNTYQKKKKSVVGVCHVGKNIGLYGAVETNQNMFATRLVEKPKKDEVKTDLALVGRYVFTNDILNILQKTLPKPNGEILLTDAIKKQIEQKKVIAEILQAKRFDCGNAIEIVKTNLFFVMKNQKYWQEIKHFLKENNLNQQ